MTDTTLLRSVEYGLAVALFVIWWTNYNYRPQWYEKLINLWSRVIKSGKPLTCPFCMSFWLSAIAWVLVDPNTEVVWRGLPGSLFLVWPIMCGTAASATVSTLVSAAYERITTINL